MVASKGTGCHIGTWANIPLFGARWLKDGLFFTTYNFIFVLLAHAKVRDIIDQSMKVCDTPLIYNLFDNVTTQLILSTHLQLFS